MFKQHACSKWEAVLLLVARGLLFGIRLGDLVAPCNLLALRCSCALRACASICGRRGTCQQRVVTHEVSWIQRPRGRVLAPPPELWRRKGFAPCCSKLSLALAQSPLGERRSAGGTPERSITPTVVRTAAGLFRACSVGSLAKSAVNSSRMFSRACVPHGTLAPSNFPKTPPPRALSLCQAFASLWRESHASF